MVDKYFSFLLAFIVKLLMIGSYIIPGARIKIYGTQIIITEAWVKPIKKFARLSRTIKLLRSFPQEQKNPAQFYIPLAQDTLSLIELFRQYYRTLENRAAVESQSASTSSTISDTLDAVMPNILDVGGGPGFFSQIFAEAGWRYTSVDVDAGDFEKYGYTAMKTFSETIHSESTAISPIHIRASGYQLPFRDDSFDVVLCSNVAEHVADPWELAAELLRVIRPGGLLFFSYTIWFGPFGGHETGPWHYVGGNFAARHYAKKYGKVPKNQYGTSLFRVDVRTGMHWARNRQSHNTANILGLFPRYHPWWAWWILACPGLRELLASNLMIVLVKT